LNIHVVLSYDELAEIQALKAAEKKGQRGEERRTVEKLATVSLARSDFERHNMTLKGNVSLIAQSGVPYERDTDLRLIQQLNGNTDCRSHGYGCV
jgi:hypothetical protein